MEAPLREWVESRLARWRDARDGDAMGELLKWQRDRAYTTALRVFQRPEDAEDAVQKAFLKLLSRTHGFESLESFRTAVYWAVVQCALDTVRSERAREKREKAMPDVRRPPEPAPDAAAEKAEAVRMLREELTGLAHEDRALVVLCCEEGLSARAAAQVLEVPRETLRLRLKECLKGLRERLKRRGFSPGSAAFVALLQQDEAAAAPVRLCDLLDASLPGASCATVAAAPAVQPTAAAVLAIAGLAAKVKVMGAIAAAALLAGFGGVGAVLWCDGPDAPAPRGGIAAVDLETEPRRPAAVSAAPGDSAVLAPGSKEPRRSRRALRLRDFLPDPVREAAERALPGLRPREVKREGTGAETRYEIEAVAKGREYDIVIRADGELLEVGEEQDDDAPAPDEDEGEPELMALEQVPTGVREAAEAAVNGVVLTEVEKRTQGGRTLYEIEGSIEGIRCKFRINEDGKVLELELKMSKDKSQRKGAPADGVF